MKHHHIFVYLYQTNRISATYVWHIRLVRKLSPRA